MIFKPDWLINDSTDEIVTGIKGSIYPLSRFNNNRSSAV